MSHLRPCFTINQKEHVEVPPRAHSRHLKTLPGKGSRPARQLTCPDCNLKARGTVGKDQCRPAGSTLIAIAKQSSRMAIKRRLLGNWNLDALPFSRWHASWSTNWLMIANCRNWLRQQSQQNQSNENNILSHWPWCHSDCCSCAHWRRCFFFQFPLEKFGLVRKGLRVPGQIYIYIYIILATLRRGDMDSTCGYLTVSLQGNILDQLPCHTGHTCGGGVVKNMPRNLWEHFCWHIWNQPAVRPWSSTSRDTKRNSGLPRDWDC